MGPRLTGNGVEKVYEAASAWVDRALRADDSLFTPGKAIWTVDNLRQVETRYVDNVVAPSGDFWEKLEKHLEERESSEEVYQLVAETLYFYYLAPMDVGRDLKSGQIENVLGWSGQVVEVDPSLIAGLASGIASFGAAKSQIRNYVGFLIEFSQQWKEQTSSERERERLLGDPWAFKDFVASSNFRNTPGAQREVLLHLVFPDTFEAIIDYDAKRKIANAESFTRFLTEGTEDIDQKIQQIRRGIEDEGKSGNHLFYAEPIRDQWDPNFTWNGPPQESGNGNGEPSDNDLAAQLYLPIEFLEEIESLLLDKKQIIFQGPPGTGKTYVARELAKHLAGSDKRVSLVQFHPSYAYEDFVQGFRPTLKNGQAGFELRDGPLMRVADEARLEPDTKHFLIIDEINRGNLAKALGELYFLLEYRDAKINLQYSDKPFSLPPNLYIIGTMNTADRSIALVDLALRRRFYFVDFDPSTAPINGLLRRWMGDNAPGMEWVAGVVDAANALLSDDQAAIGPSYFMKRDLNGADVERIWKHAVLPYVQEQLFGEPERLAEFALDRLRGADAASASESESE